MSSVSQTKIFRSYIISHDEPEEKKPNITLSLGKTAKWSPGGYEPTRATWHTLRGKLRSYFA